MSQQNIINGNPLLVYINHVIKSVLEPKEQDIYLQIEDIYGNCFYLAKENNITEAQSSYEKSLELNSLITPTLKPWITVFCKPYISYYYYKLGNYNKAVSLTNEIIATMQALYKQGYQYLFFCEIQQLHNLSRISFAEGDIQEAVSLCIKCLFNIKAQSYNWKDGELINGTPEKDLIETTQHAMISQIVTETCSRIIRMYKSEVFKLDVWLQKFITPLINLNFRYISADERYKNYDGFFLLMKKMLDVGIDEVDEDDIAFIKSKSMDKILIKIIYNYIDIVSNQITEQPSLAVA